MDTRQVIEAYYQTVNAGDWEAWLKLFDDNVVIEEQLAGHLDGIEVLRGAAGGLERGYPRFQMIPQYTMENFHDTVPFQPFVNQDLS